VALGPKATTLRIAAKMLGGPRKLRRFLDTSSSDVAKWLSGMEDPPTHAFLAALQLILDDLDSGGHRLRQMRSARKKSAVVLSARPKPVLK
jgi:hypothetical protein